MELEKDNALKIGYFVAKEDCELDSQAPCYYCGDNGIFLKKKTKIFEAFVKCSEGYQTLEEKITLTIPKIPFNIILEIVEFFKAVYNKHKAEAIALLLFNYDTKKWAYYIPKQEVSGASLDYDVSKEDFEHKHLVGTIHSHASMSAFHSGVDDNDEEHFDGIHMTIGKLSDKIEYVCSAMVHGQRVTMPFDELVEIPENTKYLTKVSKKEYKQIQSAKSELYKVSPSQYSHAGYYNGYSANYMDEYKDYLGGRENWYGTGSSYKLKWKEKV
jgi:PRTRC genetic system protein A